MDGANAWVLNLGGGAGAPPNATGVFRCNQQSNFVQLSSMNPRMLVTHVYQLWFL